MAKTFTAELIPADQFVNLLPHCQEFCTTDLLHRNCLPALQPTQLVAGRLAHANIPTPFEIPNQPGVGSRLHYLLSALCSNNFERFVDVGCGDGTILRLARKFNQKIECIGIEHDEEAAEYARNSDPSFKIWTGDALTYTHYDNPRTLHYLARPFVSDLDQSLLENTIIKALGARSMLISLLPSSHLLRDVSETLPSGVIFKA